MIAESLYHIENFEKFSFKCCPNCGKDAKLATKTVETCHGGKLDHGVLGHYFNCECGGHWVDWYKYDETAR